MTITNIGKIVSEKSVKQISSVVIIFNTFYEFITNENTNNKKTDKRNSLSVIRRRRDGSPVNMTMACVNLLLINAESFKDHEYLIIC